MFPMLKSYIQVKLNARLQGLPWTMEIRIIQLFVVSLIQEVDHKKFFENNIYSKLILGLKKTTVVNTVSCSFVILDLVLSGCWNWDGSEVLFTCKDKTIRRVDPRYY